MAVLGRTGPWLPARAGGAAAAAAAASWHGHRRRTGCRAKPARCRRRPPSFHLEENSDVSFDANPIAAPVLRLVIYRPSDSRPTCRKRSSRTSAASDSGVHVLAVGVAQAGVRPACMSAAWRRPYTRPTSSAQLNPRRGAKRHQARIHPGFRRGLVVEIARQVDHADQVAAHIGQAQVPGLGQRHRGERRRRHDLAGFGQVEQVARAADRDAQLVVRAAPLLVRAACMRSSSCSWYWRSAAPAPAAPGRTPAPARRCRRSRFIRRRRVIQAPSAAILASSCWPDRPA
jgi:hypothetical protein